MFFFPQRMNTVFPCTKKGLIIKRKWITSNIAHWKSCPKYFVYYPIKMKKWSHFGLFKCSKLVCKIIFNVNILGFRAWIVTVISFARSDSTLSWQGEKKARGVEGWRFEGGNCFNYFQPKGVIIWGRRLIQGQLLFNEIQYLCQPSLNINVAVYFLSQVILFFFSFWVW